MCRFLQPYQNVVISWFSSVAHSNHTLPVRKHETCGFPSDVQFTRRSHVAQAIDWQCNIKKGKRDLKASNETAMPCTRLVPPIRIAARRAFFSTSPNISVSAENTNEPLRFGRCWGRDLQIVVGARSALQRAPTLKMCWCGRNCCHAPRNRDAVLQSLSRAACGWRQQFNESSQCVALWTCRIGSFENKQRVASVACHTELGGAC